MAATLKPTDGELAILRVLWAQGPSTVREVVGEMGAGVGYTTALKLMQIMFEKGLVLRDEAARSHVYRPAISEERTLRHLASDLLDKAFGGSAQKLVMSALSVARASPEELVAIRKLLKTFEDEQSDETGRSEGKGE